MRQIIDILLVALGGAVGATARHLIGGWVQHRFGPDFPWGTFVVNLVGSFAIGVILGFVDRGALSNQARLFLAVGLLGGFTTFSAFSYENLQLIGSAGIGTLLLNAVGQVGLGIIAASLGVVLVRAL